MTACIQCAWDPGREVKARWLLQATGALPSQNAIGCNNGGYAGVKYRRWRAGIDAALKEQLNAIPRARRFRVGVVTRYYAGKFRAYDHENFVGGCKPLVDVLRGYGVIYNDSPAYWRGYYHQLPSTTGQTYYTVELLEFAP